MPAPLAPVKFWVVMCDVDNPAQSPIGKRHFSQDEARDEAKYLCLKNRQRYYVLGLESCAEMKCDPVIWYDFVSGH